MVLNIGPQHPSTHGVLRLRLVLDGERIVTAEPIVGYMHRGAEKLFEVRDYRQIVVLANRHDWLSAFANELGVVLAAERMLGMEVPVRAVWARTLLAELNRVLNHLMFLGSYPTRARRDHADLLRVPRAGDASRPSWRRSPAAGCTTCSTGSAGSKEELPAGWTGAGSARGSRRRGRGCRHIRDLVLGNEIFQARTRGVGVLSSELIHAYGVSGPIARASRRRLRPAPRRALPGVRRAVPTR